MQHSRVVLVVALVAAAFDASAESRLLQDARRSAWTLVERPIEKLPQAVIPSPDGADFGWLRSSELRPGGSVQLDLAPGWTVCADWDRQRPKTAVREPIDTFLLGLYFRF